MHSLPETFDLPSTSRPINHNRLQQYLYTSPLATPLMEIHENGRVLHLDGLRGFASLLVYWHHHQLWYHSASRVTLEMGFGFMGEYHLATFPGIRTFFTGGHFAVALLFVISGYALASKPLQLIHLQDQKGLADHLGSAIFRRWLRLYIPFACTTFIFMSLCHVFGARSPGFNPLKTWAEDVQAWSSEFRRFSFVFDEGQSPWFSYNNHLWSIPVELKGSMIIYTTSLAISKLSVRSRFLVLGGLVLYHLYAVDGWYGAFFLGGMFLCQVDTYQPHKRATRHQLLANYLLVFIGLYLAGVPHCTPAEYLGQNGGWYFLSLWKPEVMTDPKWFYLFLASISVVTSVSRIPYLRKILTSRSFQYLGRISYGLYLVHGPILWTLGSYVYNVSAKVRWPSGWPLGLEPEFLLANIILVPVTLCIAAATTRFIDELGIAASHRLYKRMCLSKEDEGQKDEVRAQLE